MKHLEETLKILREHQLVINSKKCVLSQKLEFRGHIISAKGVQADMKKVAAMVNWPVPKDLKALRGFLGLIDYYRGFVRNYGKIGAPLTPLLKKDAFKWNKEAQKDLETLKQAIVSMLVLAMPNFSLPFELETDASGTCVGVVLMQKGRPIAYFSQAFSSKKKLNSVYEHELMAIVRHHHFFGHPFIIKTDQKALKFLLEQRELVQTSRSGC